MIAYITDVEGNYDYWRNLIKNSKAVYFANKEESKLELRPGTSLVFGGDSGDKGLGSIRVVEQLVDLKKRYPDRVVIILGNRDVNKLRWTSELTDLEMADLEGVPGPSWVPADKRVSPKQFLKSLLATQGIENPTVEDYEKVNNRANRIRWMLKDTMGSDGDFERRRAEVALLSGRVIDLVTDDEVVESFLNSVSEGAPLLEFLRLGQLAHIANGTLFLHGGVTAENLGYVPEVNEKERELDMNAWVAKLNEWCAREVAAWTTQKTWVEGKRNLTNDWSARGANRLLMYCCPGSEPSVVYTHMLGANFNPVAPPPPVVAALKNCHINRVITGHQPAGISPSIVKHEGIELIMADTSYSDMSKPDNRGIAWTSVEIGDGVVEFAGLMPDGTLLRFDSQDPYVGRSLTLNQKVFWVKARLINGSYVLQSTEGFRSTYETLSLAELGPKL